MRYGHSLNAPIVVLAVSNAFLGNQMSLLFVLDQVIFHSIVFLSFVMLLVSMQKHFGFG